MADQAVVAGHIRSTFLPSPGSGPDRIRPRGDVQAVALPTSSHGNLLSHFSGPAGVIVTPRLEDVQFTTNEEPVAR